MFHCLANFISSAWRRRPILGPCQRPGWGSFFGRKGLGGKRWRDTSCFVVVVVVEGVGIEGSAPSSVNAAGVGSDGIEDVVAVVDDTSIGCESMPKRSREVRDDSVRFCISAARATAASFASLRVRGIVMPVNFAE